jgi:hypothetical protein
MGYISGLATINETLAKRPSSGGDFEDRPKATWVSLKGGETTKIVPLQEIDKGSPNFSEKNGLAIISIQHSNPENWKKNAECTADEGECYACEKGWRQKFVLYVNVLVDNGTDTPVVGIFSRGLGKGSVAQTLLDMAGDEDFDTSISDKTFKFSRTGTTKDDTTYSLSALPKPHTLNVEDYELFDLPQYTFKVKYEKQEAYYLDGQEAKAPAPASASAVDADW